MLKRCVLIAVIHVCGGASDRFDTIIAQRGILLEDLAFRISIAKLQNDPEESSRLETERSDIVYRTIDMLETHEVEIMERMQAASDRRMLNGFELESLNARFELIKSLIQALLSEKAGELSQGNTPDSYIPNEQAWYNILREGLDLHVTPSHAAANFKRLFREKLSYIVTHHSVSKSAILSSLGRSILSIRKSILSQTCVLLDDSDLVRIRNELRLNQARVRRFKRELSR